MNKNTENLLGLTSVSDRQLGYLILTHPNIPKPLHGISPRVIFGETWWNHARSFAYSRANYKCECCGVPKHEALFHPWLEAHEVYDIDYQKGRATYKYLVAICHACHNYIHSGRARMVKSPADYNKIMAHGDRLLMGRKLPPKLKTEPMAAWEDWRMVACGVEYKPLYASFEEWCKVYRKSAPSRGLDTNELDLWDALGDVDMFNDF